MKKIVIVGLGTVALSGCGMSSVRSTPDAPAVVARHSAVVQLLPKCPSQTSEWSGGPKDENAVVIALLAKAIPKLTEKAVSGISSWLKKQQDDLTATTTATSVSTMYVEDPSKPNVVSARNGCMVAVIGSLGEMKVVPSDSKGVWNATRFNQIRNGQKNPRGEKEGAPRQGQIPLAGIPDLYAEFAVRYDDKESATAMYLHPVFVDYRTTQAKRIRSAKKVVFSFEFSQVTASEPFSKFEVSLGKLHVGSLMPKDALLDRTSRMQPLPEIDLKASKVVPINVTSTVLETEDPSDIERKIADTLTEKHDESVDWLTKALKKLLGVKDEE